MEYYNLIFAVFHLWRLAITTRGEDRGGLGGGGLSPPKQEISPPKKLPA